MCASAISLLLTELVVVGAGFVMIGRVVFDRSSARRAALGLGIAGAMWGAGWAVDRLAGPVPSLVAASATFVLLAAALRLFTPEEIALIRSGLGKVRRKLPALRRRPSVVLEGQPPT